MNKEKVLFIMSVLAVIIPWILYLFVYDFLINLNFNPNLKLLLILLCFIFPFILGIISFSSAIDENRFKKRKLIIGFSTFSLFQYLILFLIFIVFVLSSLFFGLSSAMGQSEYDAAIIFEFKPYLLYSNGTIKISSGKSLSRTNDEFRIIEIFKNQSNVCNSNLFKFEPGKTDFIIYIDNCSLEKNIKYDIKVGSRIEKLVAQ